MRFDIIETEPRFEAIRSRGPGGQNVNKVSSAAMLIWPFFESRGLTAEEKEVINSKLCNIINSENEIILRSDEYRDQIRNKERCLEKLRVILEAALFRPKPRKPTKPTRASKERKLKQKSHRGDVKKLRRKNFDD